MKINYKNSEQESFELFKYLRKSETALKKHRILVAVIIFFFSILLTVVNYFMRNTLIKIHNGMTVDDAIYVFAPVVIGAVVAIFYLIILLLTVKENFETLVKNYKIDFDDEISLSLEDDFIGYSIEGLNINYRKEYVREIVEKQNALFIIFKNNSGISVPGNAFENEEEKEQFKKYFN